MSNEVELYKSKGLTEEEAKLVQNWIDRGRPGISKVKAEQLGTLYVLGYSCQEMSRQFPEYPVEILLWARIHYGWDKMREEYRKGVTDQVVQAAITVKAESIRFITDMMTATHTAWRKEIMKYLAAPDREEPPKCLPNSLHAYGQLVTMLQEAMSPATKPGSAPAQPTQGPLVSVTIASEKGKPATVEVKQKNVRDKLVDQLKGKKDGG